MFKPQTTILSLILIAGQALYLPAQADDQSEKLVAFSQPAAMTTGKAALEQETHQVEVQSHIIPGVAIYAHNFGGDEANRLAQEGVLIGNSSFGNYIDLQSGNVLLTPEEDIVVGTSKGKVSIAAGATVFIGESSHDVVLYDLLQTKPKQVSIMVNKQKLVMEPGRLLVITEQNTNEFEKLDINCHCVAYRNAQPLSLSNKTLKAFVAEFSIASALTTVQPLQRLTVSQHKEDKLALAKLLKAAVLLGDFATSTAPVAQVASASPATQATLADASSNQN